MQSNYWQPINHNPFIEPSNNSVNRKNYPWMSFQSAEWRIAQIFDERITSGMYCTEHHTIDTHIISRLYPLTTSTECGYFFHEFVMELNQNNWVNTGNKNRINYTYQSFIFRTLGLLFCPFFHICYENEKKGQRMVKLGLIRFYLKQGSNIWTPFFKRKVIEKDIWFFFKNVTILWS